MHLFNQQKLVRGLRCFPSKARPPEGRGLLGPHLVGEPRGLGGPSAAPRPPRPQALSSRAPSWGLQPLRGPAGPPDPGVGGRLTLGRRTEGPSKARGGAGARAWPGSTIQMPRPLSPSWTLVANP